MDAPSASGADAGRRAFGPPGRRSRVDFAGPPGYRETLTVKPLARYKAALAALGIALPAASLAEKVAGAVLPDGARPVAENRYRAERTYEETLRFYKSVYPPTRYPTKTIASLPGVRAVHIDNPEARPGTWEGLNVYEAHGETRVFVLVTPVGGKRAPGK